MSHTTEDNQKYGTRRRSKRIKIATSSETLPSLSSSSSPATPTSSISSPPPSSSRSNSPEVVQPTSEEETSNRSEGTSTAASSPTPSQSEFDKLVKEYRVSCEYLEDVVARQRRDVGYLKAKLALQDRQNMERLRVLKNKMDKFPDNQIAMLEVMLLEIIRRSSRRTNLADALQGLVEIQESCNSMDDAAKNGNKFSITYITS